MEQNLSIFMERFPALGLQMGTWEAVEAVDEEVPLIDVEKAEVLYIYGLGTGRGYSAYQKWLHAKPERQLIFLEDEPGIILSFLYRSEAVFLLSDPQVHIELFEKSAQAIEALAARFPVKRMEALGLPSKGRFQPLRLKLLRKTALAHALHLDRLHGYQPFQNFVENLTYLPESFYANAMQGAFQNVPAVICGAGPSLKPTLNALRGLENKALIIAGGSTLAALSSQGIMPHFGMAVDPNLEEYRRFRNSFAFDVPLLYSTRVHPGVFQTCNGPFGYMRSGIGGLLELWIEEELGLQDPLIGQFLPAESISVTAICIAWAQFLGCNPILLNGIDMAYTGNRRYAEGVTEEEELAFQAIDAEKSAADRILKKKDRNGKPVYTAVRWVMESAAISAFAKKHAEVQFINTTEGGIGFKGIDYVPLSEAVSSFSQRPLRQQVFAEIQKAKMPAQAKEILDVKLDELQKSLKNLIGHLEVLAGEKRGSSALAELELKEESAALFLFYDIHQVLKKDDSFWKKWLALARKYDLALLHTRGACSAMSGC